MLNAKERRHLQVLEINLTKRRKMLGNIREMTVDVGNSHETLTISPEQKMRCKRDVDFS